MSEQIIFSMVRVKRVFPPNREVIRDISLSFYYGAKIGVLGLNGAGKSTLLRIIAGVDKDYLGEVVMSPGISVGLLEQEPQLDQSKTVKQVVEEAVQPIVDLLAPGEQFLALRPEAPLELGEKAERVRARDPGVAVLDRAQNRHARGRGQTVPVHRRGVHDSSA